MAKYKSYDKCLKCGSINVETCSDDFADDEYGEEAYFLRFECEDCKAVALEIYQYQQTVLQDEYYGELEA